MRRQAALLFLALVIAAPYPVQAATLEKALGSVVSVLPQWPRDTRRTREPEGSGVVIFDGKTILTAAHIVNKAISLRVRTSDGEILTAVLKGRDLATDLAVLKIEKSLPPFAFEEQEPTLGGRVCAIGNALGEGLSVSCGVVSAKHRAGLGFNPVEDFIQTDAAVNPGSSGGALVNEEGKLAGVLSAILNFEKMPDANIGMNFAVSAALAKRAASALVDHGRFKRAISGLRLARWPKKGGTGLQGARVLWIKPGSLAETAGVKVGDVIYRAGERRVRKPADFVSVMALLESGQTLAIEIARDGNSRTLQIKP